MLLSAIVGNAKRKRVRKTDQKLRHNRISSMSLKQLKQSVKSKDQPDQCPNKAAKQPNRLVTFSRNALISIVISVCGIFLLKTLTFLNLGLLNHFVSNDADFFVQFSVLYASVFLIFSYFCK
jgi:hypothetical protein